RAQVSVIELVKSFAVSPKLLPGSVPAIWRDISTCNGGYRTDVWEFFQNSDCSDWGGRAEDKGGNHYVGFPESTGDVTAPAQARVRPQSHLVGLVNRAGQDVSPRPHRATAPRGVWGTRGRRRRRTSRRRTVQCELEPAYLRS